MQKPLQNNFGLIVGNPTLLGPVGIVDGTLIGGKPLGLVVGMVVGILVGGTQTSVGLLVGRSAGGLVGTLVGTFVAIGLVGVGGWQSLLRSHSFISGIHGGLLFEQVVPTQILQGEAACFSKFWFSRTKVPAANIPATIATNIASSITAMPEFLEDLPKALKPVMAT